jgi:hypothetical protein
MQQDAREIASVSKAAFLVLPFLLKFEIFYIIGGD